MIVRDNFEVRTRDAMEAVNYDGNFGYALEQFDYGFFAFADYIAPRTLEKMRLMRNAIIYGQDAAAIVRSWYMKDEFDNMILRVVESGIQSYWLLDVTFRQLDPAVQMAMKASNMHHLDEADAEPLRIDRMVGIFYLLAFGLTMAFGVFILELFYYRVYRRNMRTG